MPCCSYQRLLAVLCAAVSPAVATAQECTPPIGFAAPAAPVLAPAMHARLSYTVLDTIDVPVAVLQPWFDRAPLRDLLPGTAAIPRVVDTHALGTLPFPAVGATRYVCLADGSAAVERVLASEPERRFEYVVWAYTLPSARALRYGHGLFEFAALGSSTEVRWTYSFALDPSRLPGRLGPFGRWLFRRTFLQPKYAPFMHAGMRAIREGAERAHAGSR